MAFAANGSFPSNGATGVGGAVVGRRWALDGIDADDEEALADPATASASSASGAVVRAKPSLPPALAPLANGAGAMGYRKLGLLVEHLEARLGERIPGRGGGPGVTASRVLAEIERFSHGLGKWLKVAGDDKSEILQHSIDSRPLTEFKTMAEFGAFVGYTATRMGRAVEETYRRGYEDGSILFEDSRLQGSNRVTTMEVDPIHACICRHVVDLAHLSHIVECWIGQVKDLIPRLLEEHGSTSLNMVFMDQRGTTFHDDLAQLEQLGLMHPGCRIVADNTVKPGSPLYCWHTTYSKYYDTINYTLNEYLEATIEDWQVVADYRGPLAGRVSGEASRPMPAGEWERAA
eukprot:TRINITY_DN49847_c0_g1_i1.p1 TRINITY_DN49847_c0_g1~~TRINITY_DN49847_c0_g1_i1.p1  ORF type:complete len:347 (+),score=76.43 TRINITY_DN49847_c0_g1_i1:130-1170(+)